MITYILAVLAFIAYAIIAGFLAPKMVSSHDDIAVVLGFLIYASLPVIVYGIYRLWRRTKESRRVLKRARQYVPLLLVAIALGACSKVPAGNVGVVVNLYGSEKGVSEKEVGVGRYWLGWNEELYLFPTFTQNDTWQRIKSGKDESITFQTGKDGMVMNADFGITFRVDPTKVTKLFQTYRKGVEEISDIYLRNLVRDAVNERAADYSADQAYGAKKNELMDSVENDVRKAVADKGILVEKVYLIGEIRLPDQVRIAIDEKNRALQTTLQREQEIIKARAEAEIAIASARGRADSLLLEARSQAEANKLVAASITPELVRYRALDKWDGVLPRLSGGGAVPFIDVTSDAAPAVKSSRVYPTDMGTSTTRGALTSGATGMIRIQP